MPSFCAATAIAVTGKPTIPNRWSMPCCLRLRAIRVAPSISLTFPPLCFMIFGYEIMHRWWGRESALLPPSHAFGPYWPASRAASALFCRLLQRDHLGGGASRPRALFESVLQVDRDAVLLQQVGKGLVGEFLKGRHPVACQLLELGGGVVIEGDQFAHAFLDPFGGAKRSLRNSRSARWLDHKRRCANDQNIGHCFERRGGDDTRAGAVVCARRRIAARHQQRRHRAILRRRAKPEAGDRRRLGHRSRQAAGDAERRRRDQSGKRHSRPQAQEHLPRLLGRLAVVGYDAGKIPGFATPMRRTTAVFATALSLLLLAPSGRLSAAPPALAPAASQPDAPGAYNAALGRFKSVLADLRNRINARQPLPNLPGQALYLARNALIGSYKDLTDANPGKIGRPNKFGIPPAYFDADNEPLLDEYRKLFDVMEAPPAGAQFSNTRLKVVVDLGVAIARAKGLEAANAEAAGRIALGIFYAETNGNQNVGNGRSNTYKGSFQTGPSEDLNGRR